MLLLDGARVGLSTEFHTLSVRTNNTTSHRALPLARLYVVLDGNLQHGQLRPLRKGVIQV